eukprot:79728_1
MEGSPHVAVRQQPNCCLLCVGFIISGFIGLTFLIIDTMLIGTLKYEYNCSNNPNTFNCSMSNGFTIEHKCLSIHCAVKGKDESCCIDICEELGYYQDDISLDISTINPSYDPLYETIYYVCICIGCIVPYMLLYILWILCGDVNEKCCFTTTKDKCLILCFLSMIASIIGVVFGLIAITGVDNGSNGLYEYIQLQIGNEQWNKHYTWINDSPEVHLGATFIFMIINIVITSVFTLYFCQNCIRSNKGRKYQGKKPQKSLLAEGKFAKSATTKYATASSVHYSINSHNEGSWKVQCNVINMQNYLF